MFLSNLLVHCHRCKKKTKNEELKYRIKRNGKIIVNAYCFNCLIKKHFIILPQNDKEAFQIHGKVTFLYYTKSYGHVFSIIRLLCDIK